MKYIWVLPLVMIFTVQSSLANPSKNKQVEKAFTEKKALEKSSKRYLTLGKYMTGAGGVGLITILGLGTLEVGVKGKTYSVRSILLKNKKRTILTGLTIAGLIGGGLYSAYVGSEKEQAAKDKLEHIKKLQLGAVIKEDVSPKKVEDNSSDYSSQVDGTNSAVR